ncbi:MAG: ribonuclease P protein component [Parcubacteria group bacterium]|nr:ribonuclease P protein component [Parcubacteria group bacterium]
MLPKKRRVAKVFFGNVSREGKSFHSPLFSAKVLKSAVKKPSRVGFSVSKKISNKAVERNFIRRRGYSVVQNVRKQIEPSYLVVFFAKKESKDVSFIDFKDDLISLSKKIGLLQ